MPEILTLAVDALQPRGWHPPGLLARPRRLPMSYLFGPDHWVVACLNLLARRFRPAPE
jgi:hypothetical protein